MITDIMLILYSLRQFEQFYNEHCPTGRSVPPHRCACRSEPMTDPERTARLDVRRPDRLGGTLHEYRHAA